MCLTEGLAQLKTVLYTQYVHILCSVQWISEEELKDENIL